MLGLNIRYSKWRLRMLKVMFSYLQSKQVMVITFALSKITTDQLHKPMNCCVS